MCGRFVNNEKIPVQARRFAASARADTDGWLPTYNATPGRRHPVIVQEDDRHLDLMHWGWTLDFGFLPNAIGEEAFEKKSFAHAMRGQRCLIPATAVYEWTPVIRRQKGIPHAFRLANAELFAMGGIWHSEEVEGTSVASFLLLMTEANAIVQPVCHRMALMIPREHEAEWLDPATPIAAIRRIVRPFPAELMSGFRVGPGIDKAGAEGSHLLEPATGPTQRSLFE